jgi:hypothetical protein
MTINESYILTSTKFEGARLSDLSSDDFRSLYRYRPNADDMFAIRSRSRHQSFVARMATRPQRDPVAA